MKYNTLFCLIFILLFCECRTKIRLDDPLIELAIAKSWARDTCANGIRNELASSLSDNPVPGLNEDIITAWFGKPIHKHILKNGNFIYVYHYSSYPNISSCPYGDLLCVEFKRNGNLERMYPYFIVEDIDTTLFWHSSSIPFLSYEDKTENAFFLSIPRQKKRRFGQD